MAAARIVKDIAHSMFLFFRQRMAWRKGTLEMDKKKRLDDIGFVWEAGTGGSGSEDGHDFDKVKTENNDAKDGNYSDSGDVIHHDAPDFGHEGPRERHREEHVARRGRLKLEEAKSFDDWCALLQEVIGYLVPQSTWFAAGVSILVNKNTVQR